MLGKRKRYGRRGYGGRRAPPRALAKRSPFQQLVHNKIRALNSARIKNVQTAGFLGIEHKFLETALTPTALTSPTDASGGEMDPSATSMMSTPAQGDGEEQRDGKRIIIDSLDFRFRVNQPPLEVQVGPPVAVKVFVAIVLDTQSNGAQMNSEDCFKNDSGDASLAVCPMRNLLFGSRFRVLRQCIVDVTPYSISHIVADQFSFNGKSAVRYWHIRFKDGLPVNFNGGTTASIANVVDNSLHVIAYSTTTQYTPTLAYNARIRFRG